MISPFRPGKCVALSLVLLAMLFGCTLPSFVPAPRPEAAPAQKHESAATPAQPQPISPAAPVIGPVLHQAFSWSFSRRDYSWSLQVPQSLYVYYKQRPRPPTANYSVYITHPLDDPYINNIVTAFNESARRAGLNRTQTAEFVTSFVQGMNYVADKTTTPYDEYPRYPVETLVDKGGDCEDTSILLASLLRAMGYGVVLLIYPGRHAALGVMGDEGATGTCYEYQGGRYYYIETTGTRWRLGQVPDEYQKLSAVVYPMTPLAVITHEWEAKVTGGLASVALEVKNLGSAGAEGLLVLAGFDAGEGQMWNAERSQPFGVPQDQRVTLNFTLQVPRGKHTRLIVQVVQEGYAIDESHSEWFDS